MKNQTYETDLILTKYAGKICAATRLGIQNQSRKQTDLSDELCFAIECDARHRDMHYKPNYIRSCVTELLQL